AIDSYFKEAVGYAGTVKCTSNDGQAILPANVTLSDGFGMGSVTLKTAGTFTVTATDTAVPALTGTSTPIGVAPSAVTKFGVTAPATAAAGTAFSITVAALDAYNNTVTGYAGTVQFSSSD